MSPTLHNDSVDRTTYDEARKKLTQLTKDNPYPEFDPHMPGKLAQRSYIDIIRWARAGTTMWAK